MRLSGHGQDLPSAGSCFFEATHIASESAEGPAARLRPREAGATRLEGTPRWGEWLRSLRFLMCSNSLLYRVGRNCQAYVGRREIIPR